MVREMSSYVIQNWHDCLPEKILFVFFSGQLQSHLFVYFFPSILIRSDWYEVVSSIIRTLSYSGLQK
jgi:hypothetical protein